MKLFNMFSSPSHCVDYQCDTDAASALEISPAAAAVAEQLADYQQLINARPAVPPAPHETRPEQRLRTYHPIPQRTEGNVVVIKNLPCGLREIGFAVWCAMRGGVTAADVTEARQISGRMPHQHPQSVSLPADYVLPAAARAVYGDALTDAISGAAAVWYTAHEFTARLTDRRDRTAKYGAVTPIAAGVVLNGGAPDNVAKGAIPLTEGEEKLLAKWIKIRNSEAWLETSETFENRRAVWDMAARAHSEAESALRTWKNAVRTHPMRAVLRFDL